MCKLGVCRRPCAAHMGTQTGEKSSVARRTRSCARHVAKVFHTFFGLAGLSLLREEETSHDRGGG